jgi:hypothetical protein
MKAATPKEHIAAIPKHQLTHEGLSVEFSPATQNNIKPIPKMVMNLFNMKYPPPIDWVRGVQNHDHDQREA